MTRFKGVLFDLDGTLADNYTAIHLCAREAFRRLGIPGPEYEDVFKTVGGSILITMKRLLAGGDFAQKYEDAARLYLELYPDYIFCGLKPMPGAREVLEALKARGVRLGCFTNKQAEGAEPILQKLDLAKYLDCVAATSLHSPRKPEREFTLLALEKIGLGAGEVLGVGDSPFDYMAAESCEMASALVATGADSRESLEKNCPNALGVFGSLSEMAREIFGI